MSDATAEAGLPHPDHDRPSTGDIGQAPGVRAEQPATARLGSVRPDTWTVSAGRPEPAGGSPLNVPPILASNFEHGSGPGVRGYARGDGTPTWEAFEELVGGLEGGEAVAFSSGMAAAAAVVDLVPVGGTIVLPESCYQGVAGLVAAGVEQGRWQERRLAAGDTAGWLQAAEDADLLWLESPSNPLLEVADLPRLCSAQRGPLTIIAVDSTFATPLIQRPLAMGADIVVHSATKYLGGHSDLLLGVAVADSPLAQRLRTRRLLAGATPGAMEAWLAIRGIRTLSLRVERACASALALAQHLEEHPAVEKVRYPGLPSHPSHEIARGFMQGWGAIISFDVRGGAAPAEAVCRAVRIIRHATSLGSVESTIERRAALPGQEHMPQGLLRLSVGCENEEDLAADLDQALAWATASLAEEADRAEASIPGGV